MFLWDTTTCRKHRSPTHDKETRHLSFSFSFFRLRSSVWDIWNVLRNVFTKSLWEERVNNISTSILIPKEEDHRPSWYPTFVFLTEFLSFCLYEKLTRHTFLIIPDDSNFVLVSKESKCVEFMIYFSLTGATFQTSLPDYGNWERTWYESGVL